MKRAVPILLLALIAGCARSAADTSGAKLAEGAGPPLSVPEDRLRASLACTGDLASRTPILLVPGTTLDPETNFSWNYIPALQAQGWPHCTVNLPGNAMGDIQEAAEYVVYALREMARQSGGKVSLVGHSQGGMVPRWGLRFWPDTRALVDDYISLAGSHHGTVTAEATCVPDCAPAIWQQNDLSNFMAALNEGFETLPGIAYTSIYTQYDGVVFPNLTLLGASSELSTEGGAVVNIATQDVCPNNLADHLSVGTYDAVAYALAMDALNHEGPADPARVPIETCLEPFMPGVNPQSFVTDYAAFLQVIAATLQSAPHVPAEPTLRCYVTGSCPQ